MGAGLTIRLIGILTPLLARPQIALLFRAICHAPAGIQANATAAPS